MTGRVAVMGAGAVGCYYGARLARAGEAVTLIGRPALVAAVAGHGLRLEEGGRSETVAVAASDRPDAVAGADLVLLTVKAGDVDAAGRAIAPHLAPGATLLCLQNGLGHAERLAAALGRPAIPAVVYAAVSMAGPGHVRHAGGGGLVLADLPGSAAAAARFAAAGIDAQIAPDLDRTLWTKLAVNCVYNALSAVTGLPYGRIVAEPGSLRTMRQLMEECRAVAAAEGIALPEDLWTRIRRIAEDMPGQRSSMAQDLARGRRTEIDHLNGELVRRADAAGLPAPVNQALCVLVRLAEAEVARD